MRKKGLSPMSIDSLTSVDQVCCVIAYLKPQIAVCKNKINTINKKSNVPIATIRPLLVVDFVKNVFCNHSKRLRVEGVKFGTRSRFVITIIGSKVMGPRFGVAKPRVPAL